MDTEDQKTTLSPIFQGFRFDTLFSEQISDLIKDHGVTLDPAFVANRPAYFAIKRMLDLIFSFLALVILLPVLVIIAILIKLDSPGPIIFKQKRVGSERLECNGVYQWAPTEFTCYKFRTMKTDVDSKIHEQYIQAYINNDTQGMAECQGEDTKVRKLVNDPRITKLGHILRKTSLDELPQFWNILLGDMSLVGPRPAIPYETPLYKDWHFGRLHGKPGLTGLWQVTARSSTDFDEMVQLDIEYLNNQSFWLDIFIILQTPIVVLSRKGAH
jgi:lipopolysaccharide/colanic/teichoic acid biosynthesis glycosyltransferase